MRVQDWVKEAVKNHNSDSCLLWPFKANKKGYGICRFENHNIFVHRLAFLLVNGHLPYPEARHTCDIPACFNPRHIIEGTHAENMADMAARSANRGEERPGRKLSDNLVRSMRLEYQAGKISYSRLAQKYGVSLYVTHAAVNRRTWKHVA